MEKQLEQQIQSQKDEFCASLLLELDHFNQSKFLYDLAKDWDLFVFEKEEIDPLMFEMEGASVILHTYHQPIPESELKEGCERNYLFEHVYDMVKDHKAQVVVAVVGKSGTIEDHAKLFTKVLYSLCKQEGVLGIYQNDVVYEKEYYVESLRLLKDKILPLYNLVWFGLFKSKNGMCGYTKGLENLGHLEIEVINTSLSPSQVRNLLVELCALVLTSKQEDTLNFALPSKSYQLKKMASVLDTSKNVYRLEMLG